MSMNLSDREVNPPYIKNTHVLLRRTLINFCSDTNNHVPLRQYQVHLDLL